MGVIPFQYIKLIGTFSCSLLLLYQRGVRISHVFRCTRSDSILYISSGAHRRPSVPCHVLYRVCVCVCVCVCVRERERERERPWGFFIQPVDQTISESAVLQCEPHVDFLGQRPLHIQVGRSWPHTNPHKKITYVYSKRSAGVEPRRCSRLTLACCLPDDGRGATYAIGGANAGRTGRE